MSSDAPCVHPALPDVDDRLAPPGTPYEVHDGELVAVSPADESHATRHSKIQTIIETHVGIDFDVACDMLTRLTKVDDKAPDVSVFPLARDPNGRRQIEQLAFEVVSTQDIGRAGTKAAQLVARGVRRVFAIDVERSRALEWSAALGTWSVLDLAGHIEDPALDVPVSIDALVHAAKADDAVARALVAKHNPIIEAIRAQDRSDSHAEGKAEGKVEGLAEGKAEGLAEGKAEGLAEGKAEGLAEGHAKGKAEGHAEGHAKGEAEGHAKGKAEGLAEALFEVLALRGVTIDGAIRARLLGEQDRARLKRWLMHAMTCAITSELFDELDEP